MNASLQNLTDRGLVHSASPDLAEALASKESPVTVYFGIDPTGDSLHIGHFMGVTMMKRLYDMGCNLILLVGGGTAMIGDPGGKDAERPILPKEQIEANKEKIKAQLSRFFEFDDARVRMVDNAEWLEQTNLISFLRDAGKYITVNSMIDKDSVSARIGREGGISYAEFSYQLLQAYDYMELFQRYECNLQIGGSDQWGNIIQGVELIRKRLSKKAFGLSFPLIVNPKTGKKFGKTESGESIWLDAEKTTPFAFYQFFLNVDDDLAPVLMKYYSFKSLEEIAAIEADWNNARHERTLQKILAYEMTARIHGEEAAQAVERITGVLFGKSSELLNETDVEHLKGAIPTVTARKDISPEDAVVELGLVTSKGEARRLVQQNGIHMQQIGEGFSLVRKGKKEYGLLEFTS